MKELTPIIFIAGGAVIALGSHWITAWFLHRKYRGIYSRAWNAAREFSRKHDNQPTI